MRVATRADFGPREGEKSSSSRWTNLNGDSATWLLVSDGLDNIIEVLGTAQGVGAPTSGVEGGALSGVAGNGANRGVVVRTGPLRGVVVRTGPLRGVADTHDGTTAALQFLPCSSRVMTTGSGGLTVGMNTSGMELTTRAALETSGTGIESDSPFPATLGWDSFLAAVLGSTTGFNSISDFVKSPICSNE